MDFRSKIIDRFRGNNNGKPLFIPRLDIWYNTNKRRNTLPDGLQDLSLMQVAEKLGVGYHSVIPTFLSTGKIEDIHHRVLGFYNHPDFPYYADFSAVDYTAEVADGELKVVYNSSLGTITTRANYSEEFFRSGSSVPDILEHPLKEHDDYLKLAEIFSKVKIVPQPESFIRYYNRVGTQGAAVAFITLAAGPMQHILRDLRAFEQFIYDLYDIPHFVDELVKPLSELYNRMLDSVMQTPAEIVLFGGNYDAAITCPPFYNEHIKPWLIHASKKLHSCGKLLLTHTDGENKGLLQPFVDSEFDIADSVCPLPMTSLTLADHLSSFQEKVSIWGGIPSVLMLASSCSENDFKDSINKLLDECYPYDNLIFSIADTSPPDMNFDRFLYICERIKA